MIINTNISALNTQRNMKIIGKNQAKAFERLSSGYKINRAADGAAGLAISEKMKGQIRGMQQDERNVKDGISLIQTAEGGMNEISNMVLRQRELIIQALNDTYTDEDRDKIQMEIDQLTFEIDCIAEDTEFNEIPLLSFGGGADGGPSTPLINRSTATDLFGTREYSTSHVDFVASQQVPQGSSAVGNVRIKAGEVLVVNDPDPLDIGFILTVTKPDGSTVQAPVDNLNDAGVYRFSLDNVSGSVQNSWNVCVFLSKWQSSDSSDLWIQSGPNSEQGMYINRYDCRSSSLNINPILAKPRNVAEDSLNKLDRAQSILNAYRANCGAQQNRLEHAEAYLGISVLNLEEADSRIADADMAEEMIELSTANILQQASTAMLTQANQRPQSVLQLLQK